VPLRGAGYLQEQGFHSPAASGLLLFARAKRSKEKARQSQHPQEELHKGSAIGLKFHSQVFDSVLRTDTCLGRCAQRDLVELCAALPDKACA
jgi:hypothetical protein